MDLLRRLVLSGFVIFFVFFSFNLLFLNASLAGAEVTPDEQLQDEAVNIGQEELQPEQKEPGEPGEGKRSSLYLICFLLSREKKGRRMRKET